MGEEAKPLCLNLILMLPLMNLVFNETEIKIVFTLPICLQEIATRVLPKIAKGLTYGTKIWLILIGALGFSAL